MIDGYTFVRMGEDESIERALHLMGPAQSSGTQLYGIGVAAMAMWHYRSAPPLLAPALADLLRARPDVRAAALNTVTASLVATRTVADRLVPLLADRSVRETIAVGLGGAGDHRAADHLLRMLRAGSREPRLGEALTTTNADPAALSDAARVALRRGADTDAGGLAMRVLWDLGPAATDAVPDLVATVQRAVDRGTVEGATWPIRILTRIGPPATAAIPLLRRCMTEFGVTWAAQALAVITSDRTIADRYLQAEFVSATPSEIGCELLAWLARVHDLTPDQHRLARRTLADGPLNLVAVAEALWHHAGPAAVPEFIGPLTSWLNNDYFGPPILRLLATMGRHARPALPTLDELIGRRGRIAAHIGDLDAEMRADEIFLPLAIDARTRIAGQFGTSQDPAHR